MFVGRAKYYSLEKPVKSNDMTGFSISSWEKQDDIAAYIVKKTTTKYRTNELDLVESSLVAYTQDSRPEKGWRIGGNMIVDYVSNTKSGYALSLSMFEGE